MSEVTDISPDNLDFSLSFIQSGIPHDVRCIYRAFLLAQRMKTAMQEPGGSILGSGKSPREGNGNPFPYSCLENSIDREAWQATVHGITKNQTQLSD